MTDLTPPATPPVQSEEKRRNWYFWTFMCLLPSVWAALSLGLTVGNKSLQNNEVLGFLWFLILVAVSCVSPIYCAYTLLRGAKSGLIWKVVIGLAIIWVVVAVNVFISMATCLLLVPLNFH